MMTYEIFKDVVVAKFMGFMPERYQHMHLETRAVNKVNTVMDTLTMVDDERISARAFPNLYINDLYAKYLKCEDLDAVLEYAAAFLSNALDNAPDVDSLGINREHVQEEIVFQVINTAQNAEMLKTVPHREFLDLSIVYRWIIGIYSDRTASAIVTNEMAEDYGMTEGQLFKCAVENTKRILPPTVKSLCDVLREMFVSDDTPVEMVDLFVSQMPEDEQMWVLGNNNGYIGASVLLYEDILHELAMKLDSDLYILPSSIHECLAIAANHATPDELAAMVSDVNMQEVALEERLSNQVYFYDKDARKVYLATDTPNRRLDGEVAKPRLVYSAN